MAYVFRLQLFPPPSSPLFRSPQKRRLPSNSLRLHLSQSPAPSSARLMFDAIPLRNHSTNIWDSSNHEIFESLQASVQKLLLAVSISFSMLAAWPASSMAASGGRVGGRAFSSSPSFPSLPSSSNSPMPYHFVDHSFRASSDTSMDYWISSPPPHVRVGLTRASASADNSGMGVFLVMVSIYCVAFGDAIIRAVTRGRPAQTAADMTSVMKLQVGLTSMSGPLHKNLCQIAENADTSSLKGLSDLLTGFLDILNRNQSYNQKASLLLLRNLDRCIYAYQKAAVSTTINEVEKCFNKLSIEERGKFDKETLINVDNIKRKPSASERLMMPNNEYLVITILVAAKGEHTLPVISSSMDLEGALSKLGSTPSSEILAVEILWTPQSEDDFFSEQDLLEKYPLLSPL